MYLINDVIYDYKLLQKYFEEIKEYEFLPYHENELDYELFITDNTNLEIVNELFDKPIKSKLISENEYRLFLDNIDIKLEIFKYSYLRLYEKNSNNEVMSQFINELFSFAIIKRSSDIHIEAKEDSFEIRFRIDGILKQVFKFEKDFFEIVSSVLKLKSNLEIVNTKDALNSRLSMNLFDRDIDFRISFMPIIYGESIVIRILDNSKSTFNLEELNILEREYKTLTKQIQSTTGLILITGPTGSGKSTTQYAIMKKLANNSKKLISIEDPIEYKINDVQQIAVDNERGFDFNTILKNILRQDPDIMMIGEIRDFYSLSIAITAASTGHLVFATLHTNNAVESIIRLRDLAKDNRINENLSEILKAIVAQRLVLKLCDNCKEKTDFGYKKVGCKECDYTGFKGRTLIAEVLEINSDISKMIRDNLSTNEIKLSAKESGFRTFEELKPKIIEKGLSTEDEIFKSLGI